MTDDDDNDDDDDDADSTQITLQVGLDVKRTNDR